jgi:hypothetical protein
LNLAWVSLAMLAITVILSCTTSVNPGAVAIVFAWVIGVYLGPASGSALGLKAVVAGFPSELFLTLVGVMWLFSQAQANGTLERVTRSAVRCCRGNSGVIPLAFFGLALGSPRSARGTSRPRRSSARWRWPSPSGRRSRPS